MHVKPSGVNRLKLLYEIGVIVTAKPGKWLPLDLRCDGQTANKMHTQVSSALEPHPSTEPNRRTYEVVLLFMK